MTSTNKKPSRSSGSLRPINRPARHASQPKSAVGPPKAGVSAQPLISPIAQLKTAPSVKSVTRPVAPPVYRPSPVPRALQTKKRSGQTQQSDQTSRPVVGPPVYRPEAKKIAQPKALKLRQATVGSQVARSATEGIARPESRSSRKGLHDVDNQTRHSKSPVSRVAQARMRPSYSRALPPVRTTTTSHFTARMNAIQRSSEPVAVSHTPTKQISWDDLVALGKEFGLSTKDLKDGSQLLGPDNMTYPHFHLWKEGKVALSYGENKNYKVGQNSILDIGVLIGELSRYKGDESGAVLKFIRWLLASSS